jgi:hypothetical protein
MPLARGEPPQQPIRTAAYFVLLNFLVSFFRGTA